MPAGPALAPVDTWALTDLVTRLRRVLRSGVRDSDTEPLPVAQVEIMQRLRDEPGLRNNDLARRHRLASNTISVLVQQLVVAGYVVRGADASDRRAVRLELSPDGRQALERWQQAHERQLSAALQRLTDEDRVAVTAALPALSRLTSELEQSAPDRPIRPERPSAARPTDEGDEL
jgi:DNA-binding MarR family transcriptional regulator